jgi:hypothetical protein
MWIGVTIFIYGFVRWIDSPIQHCSKYEKCNCEISQYCNKFGQPKSAEDFESFNTWQVVMPLAIGLAFGGGLISNRFKKLNQPWHDINNT